MSREHLENVQMNDIFADDYQKFQNSLVVFFFYLKYFQWHITGIFTCFHSSICLDSRTLFVLVTLKTQIAVSLFWHFR